MLGFSFAELIVVFIVIIIFVKPQDLPEIARFLGRIYYKIKSLFRQIMDQLKEVEKEIGLDEIKNEINQGINQAKIELEEKQNQDFTTIVDIYGKEHKVPNINKVRSDLSKEELKAEIAKYNKKNSKSKPAKVKSTKPKSKNTPSLRGAKRRGNPVK